MYNENYPNNNINNEDNYPPIDPYSKSYTNINRIFPNDTYNDKYLNNNNDDIEKDQLSDTSSNNESLLNGVPLIENKKVTKEPRIYTSQSFFINKNNLNELNKNNNFNNLNNNNTNSYNQLPMTMKGDFVSLIEQNPKILTQKNPRIQVTNATCDLNQIINNDNNNDEDELNDEEINTEINKLNNNYIIDKNKVLNKVIQNCDQDLYANQKPFHSKKDKWFSVSIPLNDNEAKWEFLNNIKGERDKNNLNKFELIQKELDTNKNEDNSEESYNKNTFKPNNTDRRSKSKKKTKDNKDNSYKLQEMNFSQYYRSPMRSPKNNKEEKPIKTGSIIKRPGKRRNLHGSKSFLNKSGENIRNNDKNNNNYRSRGNIFDRRFRSIEYDDENEEDNYSDE